MSREKSNKSPFDQRSYFDHKPDFLSTNKWQRVVDELATNFGTAGAWIMQANSKGLEAMSANRAMHADAPAGTHFDKDVNIYCKKVVDTNEPLYVKDAAAEQIWEDNPEYKEAGLSSYYGMPVQWPDGSVFGTICVLDNKEIEDSEELEDQITDLKDLVENDLKNIALFEESASTVVEETGQEAQGVDIVNYSGELAQNVIARFMEEIENSIGDIFMVGKVSIVTVELCQNMLNYSKAEDEANDALSPRGSIRVIKRADGSYAVESTNIVSQQDKQKIDKILVEIGSLDKAGIKKSYRALRKSGKNTHSKGGGIGYYEIAKISNLFDYTFSSINDTKDSFNYNITIEGKK
ncbi:MAG: SiaB family protein kinase [Pseudomonadales bacterium]